LRATRRAIRILSRELKNSEPTMEYGTDDDSDDSVTDVENNNCDDDENTPLEILRLVKKEMRKARRDSRSLCCSEGNSEDSDVEYDHAYDHDDRSTMKRILRATRRAIRIMTNELKNATAESPAEIMEYEAIYSDRKEDSDNTKYENDVTSLDILRILRRAMRAARRNN